ncbi:(2Fe-2S)-binding protein [Paenactinomyces guangxiensis]|uniref:Copper chaperone Copz family protein n=1 Tax=Paenactinomyces guangxiensis TaxID=1490290 RepID=A0A7W1WUR4_9BACL|nr:copper chaperone Copz family protein [Paenactinomyces guangxiensis]MBA4496416.1 copper chaperone Copz family protein [Paenactinomyces guangxiensis]MBH8593487.1 (2Fe-2S)-binding protein [Paenactinomyces guangxiensis]
MTDCCTNSSVQNNVSCPQCNTVGRKVKIITLKSLLLPEALKNLNVESPYYFCSTRDCKVVYYNEDKETYQTEEIKVPIFQKNTSNHIPVCYCFGWTRKRIVDEVKKTGNSSAMSEIKQHIKEKRCGCEVNNPQGSCCLSNISSFVEALRS